MITPSTPTPKTGIKAKLSAKEIPEFDRLSSGWVDYKQTVKITIGTVELIDYLKNEAIARANS